IGNAFRRMIMTRVQGQELAAGNRVTEIKFVRPDDITFRADAEELRLDRIQVEPPIELLGKNRVQRLHQALARPVPVGWRIFVSVRNPNIRDARFAENFAKSRADATASDAMLD